MAPLFSSPNNSFVEVEDRSVNSNFMCRTLGFVFVISLAAVAQHGTAPNNYYPPDYNGSIFTGTVVRTTSDTITLAYTHKSKVQTFEGRALALCDLPVSKTSTSEGTLSQVSIGWVVTAFYEPRITKASGKKEKYNQLIALTFKEVNGRPVDESSKAIFFCIPKPYHRQFMAFQN